MKKNIRYLLLELFIVILGISIAFALNNWQENRKAHKKKMEYVDLLTFDIENNNESLRNLHTAHKKKLEAYQMILTAPLDQPEVLNNLLSQYQGELMEFSYFLKDRDTYAVMQQSGDLNLIKDLSLKVKLARLESYYADFLDKERDYRAMRDQMLIPYFREHFHPREGRWKELEGIEQHAFLNSVYLPSLILQDLVRISMRIVNLGEETLTLLKEKQ